MILPRSIVAVYAMARPRRPPAELAALRAAAGERGSARCRADRVARQVVDYLAREEAAEPGDVEAFARRLAAALSPSPVEVLAMNPEVDTAALLRAERLARFEARCCRQLGRDAWARETAEALEIVRAALARRYARLLA